MKKRKMYNVYIVFLLLCSFLASCSSALPSTTVAQPDITPTTAKATPTLVPCKKTSSASEQDAITVTVHSACPPLLKSQMELGVTYIDQSLSSFNINYDAVYRANTLLKEGVKYRNTHIMGWGAPDPWPDPNSPEPTDWNSLDERLKQTVEFGNTPILSLATAPWWMKGRLEEKGKTRALTANDEWALFAYESRLLDNRMDDWLHLVKRVAERYMVAPYNVRHFQVWNEMKGYYNPSINRFDFTTSPGDPSGPNAKHGYTYMYNRVYQTLLKVADTLGVPRSEVKIGGPYVFMDTWSSKSVQSNPSMLKKPYGVLDQRPLEVIKYWLQHKEGAGFLTIDGSIENRDTGALETDPFTSAEKFADIAKWIRALDPKLYPGANTLPIWLAEWFSSADVDPINNPYDNVIKAHTMIEFIKASGGVALAWGGWGDGTSDQGLFTNTQNYDGGQANNWYFTAKAFKDNFPAGTPIYETEVSQPKQVSALASEKKMMLVNKTNASLTVKVQGEKITLEAYQVSVIDYKP